MTASYSSRHGEWWAQGKNTDLTGTTSGNTVFFRLVGAGGNSSTESDVEFLIPKGARIVKLITNVSANTIAETSTVTVRKNGADTALQTSYDSSGTGDKTSTGSVSVSEGDEVALELTAGGADADSITLFSWAVVLTFD